VGTHPTSWKTPLNTRQLAGGRKAARRKARHWRLLEYGLFLYKRSVGLRRTKHAVFDIKYHLVWIPKYRRKVLVGEVAEYTKEMLQRIADEYGFWVDTMEVMEDHVHVFLEVPPKFSPAEVVQILKSVSAREVFKKFRRLRRELWSGELWVFGQDNLYRLHSSITV